MSMIKFSYHAENKYPPEAEWRLTGEFGLFSTLRFESHLMRVYANKHLQNGEFPRKEILDHA